LSVLLSDSQLTLRKNIVYNRTLEKLVKVKSKFIKRHKNYTISTETEALATLRLATYSHA